MKTRILVDLHEVLADFRGAACKVHNVDRLIVEAKSIELSVWDMAVPLGISLADFWHPIQACGIDFWADLEPFVWAKDLVKIVTDLTTDWQVVTSPSPHEDSYTGTIRWVKRFFGPKFDRVVSNPYKEILAQEGVILIDDREENIEKFIRAGGDGIIFPSVGNRLHAQRHDPLRYVREQLSITDYLGQGK